MVQQTLHYLITGILLLFLASGCKEVPLTPVEKLDEGPSSITVVSGSEETGEDSAIVKSDSTLYNFNDLAWNCVDNHQFSDTYHDLVFDVAPRWAICDARSDTEGQDTLALLPVDMRLHHNRNNGTSKLEDTRIALPEPADSVSLITANYDKKREDFIPAGFSSWLVAYDSLGNEIDRARNTQGNYTGVELVVRAAPDSIIHTIGIETYPDATYLDNLKTWFTTGPEPDTTAPQITYTVENDTLTKIDRKLKPALSGISAEDDRGGPVTLTVSVESTQEVIGPANPTAPDWELMDNGDGSVDVTVRAEYTGKNTGRVYTITMEGEDSSGNVAGQTFEVVVPPNSKK